MSKKIVSEFAKIQNLKSGWLKYSPQEIWAKSDTKGCKIGQFASKNEKV